MCLLLPALCTFGPICLPGSCWCFATGCMRSLCAGFLVYFLHRVFWACLLSLVALSETWVPAGFSGVKEKTLLLLCWPPLFGACSRRCGSCRPPEFRFGLRSPWCVCFFLDLGCLVCTFGPICLLGSFSLFFASWQCANWAWNTLLAAFVPFVLGVLAYFLHRVFWACFRSLVALSGTWVPAGFSGIREKTLLLLCRLPLFGACSWRCGSCRPPGLTFVAASALARLRLFLSAPPWRLLVVISYVMHAVHRLLFMCFLVPVLLHPAGFRGPILPWLSFSGRRCSGPVPGAAAVASFLPSMLFLRRRVSRFGSSCHGVASCLRAHVCTATSTCPSSRCFCQFAADHSPLFSALLPPCWPPLLGACLRCRGSCRLPILFACSFLSALVPACWGLMQRS